MTSSPCSKNAVNTEYWPGRHIISNASLPESGSRHTFVGTTCDQDFLFDIQVSAKRFAVVGLDRLPQANTTLRVRVVVGCDSVKGFFCSSGDPRRWSEVHVALAKVYTVTGQVGSTVIAHGEYSGGDQIDWSMTHLKMDHTSCANARPSLSRDENRTGPLGGSWGFWAVDIVAKSLEERRSEDGRLVSKVRNIPCSVGFLDATIWYTARLTTDADEIVSKGKKYEMIVCRLGGQQVANWWALMTRTCARGFKGDLI